LTRVFGLDAIRALCALWVVLGHFGAPPILSWVDRSTTPGWLITGAYGNFWNGPAAVIVFFVISGFCIHYPFSRTLQIPSIAGYLSRRYIRICIPMLVAMPLASRVGVTLDLFHDNILWSLAAELVYYTLYPALLSLRRRHASWQLMIVGSYVLALLVASTNPTTKDYAAFGLGLNWVLGLPCWLVGCELADRTSQEHLPKGRSIWWWRSAVWGTSVVCSILNFHSQLVSVWTLNFFALLVGWWLALEIHRYQARQPFPWLEAAGQWSYSVYLTHLPAAALLAMWGLPDLGNTLNWLVKLTFVLCAGYLFYRLVESPSHKLARVASRTLASVRAGRARVGIRRDDSQ
jgi:peptidoglycan/LPS O-acetylase OafA/YrhL